MKISISRSINGNYGYMNFTRALMESMQDKYDVHIVGENDKADIHFILISGELKPKKKNIVRIDGIYYDRIRMSFNNEIARCINSADGVVYQSIFSRKFCSIFLKSHPKESVVIYNGVDQRKFEKSSPNKRGFDKIFMACASWRVNKRPESIINSFLEFSSARQEKIGLFFVGPYSKPVKDKRIIYFGSLPHSNLYRLYKSADFFCHICHLESCPNVVVEALSVGMPILCNNIGGTPEIVREDGIVLPLDKSEPTRPLPTMELTGSRYINNLVLAKGMESMVSKKWDIKRPDLDISVSADEYWKFFNKVLDN